MIVESCHCCREVEKQGEIAINQGEVVIKKKPNKNYKNYNYASTIVETYCQALAALAAFSMEALLASMAQSCRIPHW